MPTTELVLAGGVLLLIVVAGLASTLFHRKLPTPEELSKRLGLDLVEPGPEEIFRLVGESVEGWPLVLAQRRVRGSGGESTVTCWTLEPPGLEGVSVRLEPWAESSRSGEELKTGDRTFDRELRLFGCPEARVIEVFDEDLRLRASELLEQLVVLEVAGGRLELTAPELPSAREVLVLYGFARDLAARLGAPSDDAS